MDGLSCSLKVNSQSETTSLSGSGKVKQARLGDSRGEDRLIERHIGSAQPVAFSLISTCLFF
jgi:hypothetical protein